MADTDEVLSALRAQLDALDDQLVRLINERAALAKQIGSVKAAAGMRVYAPDRERQVLDRVCAQNLGPISGESLRHVYRELMSASLALERAPRLAILGPTGSFSHLAGRRRFGASVDFAFVNTIRGVFDEVEHGHADFGLAPIENSIAGGIGESLDALVVSEVSVCGELNLAVHHHLLGAAPLESVEYVYSKPEVFTQCHKFLAATGLSTKTVAMSSTSAAAERAAGEPHAAAIAGELAAQLWNLPVIADNIEDDRGNITRFLIIGKTAPQRTGKDKTSIVFGVGHAPGRLLAALEPLRESGVNMTRIESRADRQNRWSYLFFVDVEGHMLDTMVRDCLAAMEPRCTLWRVLGSYPRADEVL